MFLFAIYFISMRYIELKPQTLELGSYFFYTIHTIKVLFGDYIFKKKILSNLELVCHIFSGWILCMSIVGKTPKQIAEETTNSAFNISIIYRRYLKHLMKIDEMFSIQGHKKFRKYYVLSSLCFFLSVF